MSTETPSPAPLPPASLAPPPGVSPEPHPVASEAPLSGTSRTTLRRHKERGRTSRADLYAVLDAGLICHLGVVIDGSPRVLPTTYGRSGDTLYLHGSSANAGFMAADGTEACVTVTHLDGLVLARSVFSHSVNYRSAIVIGTATLLRGEDERMAALRTIVEHLVPGQWAAARQPTAKEMAATAVLALPLAEASVKVREGGPADDPGDIALDVWAGVLPAAVTFGPPEPDPALRSDIRLPSHISRFPDTRFAVPGLNGNLPNDFSPADTARMRA
jgi:nitroimidazol reductase NimA-like FMN-containing flavoprotein (pyridoxamine 5'-phosphate oxidase superfamily)